jgi:endonuclease/exonuclease/phosphatase (EEP) superfamily protein YafD
LCGDFNDTPVSYSYNQLTKNLGDSFTGSGRGLGATYIGRLPSYRIDYILHSEDLTPLNFQVSKIRLSDHYPISCYFSFKE